jgi:hypothetical protein
MYLVIVFLSVILPMLWLSSELKRNLIIAQNLTLTNKEALISKETMTNPIELDKSFNVKIKVVEKGTNTDPIDITTQKYPNSVEVRISSDVEIQMMENPSILTE